MIRIGYACVNTRLPSASRTCRLKRADKNRLIELSRANVAALKRILDWNREHEIRLFRISSETIPFASHPVNRIPWWDLLGPDLRSIGNFVRRHRMRVSMHPGQYTVLNSPHERVVENSLAELEYHARFLDALGVGSGHRIVIHLGGTYGNKVESMARLAANFRRLTARAARRIALENDEKSYTLSDVLTLGRQLRLPVILDVFHHACNPSFPNDDLTRVIRKAAATWRRTDGPPKLHYSDPRPGGPLGAHAKTVNLRAFRKFYRAIKEMSLDVMLEVKDKEGSVLNVYRSFPELVPRRGERRL
jgi:UV DNA damage endonuclease